MSDASLLTPDSPSSSAPPPMPEKPLHTLHFHSSQRLLMISDLHLEPARPDITETLFTLLNKVEHGLPIKNNLSKQEHTASKTRYDALFILGDFFEVWIGDDHETPLTLAVAERLRRVAKAGTKIYFTRGNRDFLLGNDYCDHTQMTLLDDVTLLTITQDEIPSSNGKEALNTLDTLNKSGSSQHDLTYALLHGDQLCTEDKAYMSFRNTVRNPAWQAHFLSQPLQERLSIALSIRQKSQQQQQSIRAEQTSAPDAQDISDVSESAVLSFFKHLDNATLIHGHTHRPAIHDISTADSTNVRPLQRAVLGDWDQKAWAMMLHENDLTLFSFPLQSK